MTHPKLHDPVIDEDVKEALGDADDQLASIVHGDKDNGARELIYRFLSDLPDGWLIMEVVEKLEGKT